MKKFDYCSLTLRILLLLIIVGIGLFITPQKTNAAAFTQAYVRLDRMKINTTTGGTVCAKPATAQTEASVQVTFPGAGTQSATDFGVNSTFGNWTVTTTNLPSGASAWVSIGTATAVSGSTVTFPSGDLVVGTLYCFNFTGTSTLSTPTSIGSNLTGSIVSRTSAPATIDSTTWATAAITDDQIAVSATVSQIFTFSLSGLTLPIGTLSTSSVTSSTSRTVNIATNAAAGWIVWVKSLNAALSSATTGTSISSPGTSNDTPDSLAGQAGYVLGVAITTDGAGTGTVTQAAGYGAEFVDGTNVGGHLSTIFDPIAASSGTTDGDVLTLTAKAKVAATQAPATDYNDTLTVVGAGRF